MVISAEIKKMELSDLDAVFELDQQEYGSHWTRDQLRQFIINEPECYVLKENQGLVGFFILKMVGEEADLLHLGISEAYQGKGYGKLLFQKLLALLSSRSVKKLFLEVRASNEKAIRLYESFGAKIQGRRKNYYTYCSPAEDAKIFVLKAGSVF